MGLSKEKKNTIKNMLKSSILNKFKKYKPETENMPFHYRLLGKDRMALYSFIQSINTTFGTSIYEPIAIELAKDRFKSTVSQYKPHNSISSDAHLVIQKILNEITTSNREPNKCKELEEIRTVCRNNDMNKVNLANVDVFLENDNNDLFFIDIKTVKPNISGFVGHKRTLLEWAAAEMAKNQNVKINTYIAIPYNPYEPKAYKRWTMRGIFDLEHEILVADEFWDFLGGPGAYEDLLDSFELAGIELRPEMDKYFSNFK